MSRLTQSQSGLWVFEDGSEPTAEILSGLIESARMALMAYREERCSAGGPMIPLGVCMADLGDRLKDLGVEP